MKQLKRPTSLISHWFPVEMVHNGPKLCKRKRCFLCCKNFQEVSRYALWKLTSCRFRKCDGFYAIIFITLFLNCIIIVFFSFTVINLLSYFSVSGILYFNSSWCDTFQMPMCWKVMPPILLNCFTCQLTVQMYWNADILTTKLRDSLTWLAVNVGISQ